MDEAGPVKVLGHRGAVGAAPANTLASFRLALDHGAHGFELDLRGTADGELVVLHDDELAKATDGRGRVSRSTAALVRRLRIEGEPVAFLAEALALAREDLTIQVELKQPGIEAAAVAAVEASGAAAQVEYSSFFGSSVRVLSRLVPEARVMLVQGMMPHLALRRARRLGAHGVTLPAPSILRTGLAQSAAAAGLSVYAWGVEPEHAAPLRAAGVEAAITDDPEAVLAALREA